MSEGQEIAESDGGYDGVTQMPNRVRVLFADQLNLARGKYVPMRFAEGGRVRFCVGTYAVTYSRQMIAAPGAGVEVGLPDMEAVFEPAQIQPSWEPNTGVVIADLQQNGEPSQLCGRSALRSAIEAWRKHGLEPMIGIEGEAYIFQRDENGEWVPYDTPGAFVYGTGPFTDPAGLIDEIWSKAEELGIPIESFNSEFDFPQFELTLSYTDAMQACDDFFLFRNMAREILYKRGYLLSFMPKPIEEKSGTGLHVNLSFKDSNGKNVLAGGTQEGALSDIVRGCVAGLVKHHEALGGILAPTVNSYARLKPGSLSGYWANWGFDHRGTAVRISGEGGAASRIEHRVADCAANPYLAVAAVLHAARLGFEQSYELTEPERGDGFENLSTDHSIAASLTDSLDALTTDTALTEALGQLLIDNYEAIKRAEIEELDGRSHREIFDYYAPFI